MGVCHPGAIIGMDMGEGATAPSISELQVERAVTDLEAEGLINAMGGTSYSLTVDGRNRIEDRDGKLSRLERREATALAELVDMLSLMRLRAELATKNRS